MPATTDTHLAGFDVDTLMTKAFELTHRLHEADDSDLRAQRDAIVREMQRRSDGMERALVTVEVAERVMRLADEALTDGRDASDAARVMRAREALDMGMERTTTTTCSLVKALVLSDRIVGMARDTVTPIARRIAAMEVR